MREIKGLGVLPPLKHVQIGSEVEVNVDTWKSKLKTTGIITGYFTTAETHVIVLNDRTTLELRADAREKARGEDTYRYGGIRLAIKGAGEPEPEPEEEAPAIMTDYDEQSDMEVEDTDYDASEDGEE